MRRSATATATLATVAILLATPTAQGRHRHVDPPAGTNAVVALGDSYISGEAGRWRGNGNTPDGTAYGTDLAAVPSTCNTKETHCGEYDTARVYGDTYDPQEKVGCNRSVRSEITHVDRVRLKTGAQDIPAANRYNFACSGATTDAVVRPGFKRQNAQIDDLYIEARAHTVRLVALSVGGNDIQFREIVKNCMLGFITPRPAGWHCNEKTRPQIPERLAAMREAVRGTLKAIRATMARAGYTGDDYRLVLQSYPLVIPTGGAFRYAETDYSRYRSGGCPFYDDDATWAHDELVPALNQTLRDIAAQESDGPDADVDFLDLRDALAGHEVCAATVQQSEPGYTLDQPLAPARSEWVRFYGGYFRPQGQEQETIHPNALGQQALGACLRTMADTPDRVHACPPPT
ncbi:SGNH/GDSL hydrolase family protein [Embleya sp. NPDC020886]|uniref:SGNH/GDSL hydrolase family protein n=1 Tax=Embleya sp. NPDC020886 TaxID=3363980 RepID=UPI00379E7F1F